MKKFLVVLQALGTILAIALSSFSLYISYEKIGEIERDKQAAITEAVHEYWRVIEDDSASIEEVVDRVDGLLDSYPRSAELLTLQGMLHRHAGNYKAAERRLRDAHHQDPEYLQALTALGQILIIQGKTEEAVTFLEKAKELGETEDHEDVVLLSAKRNILLLLGLAYTEVGESGKAQRVLNDAISQDPSDPVAHKLRGNLARQERDYPKAAEHYRKAMEQDPGNPRLVQYYVEALVAGGRLDTVKEQLEEEIQVDPDRLHDDAVTSILFEIYSRLGEAASAADLRQKTKDAGN